MLQRTVICTLNPDSGLDVDRTGIINLHSEAPSVLIASVEVVKQAPVGHAGYRV